MMKSSILVLICIFSISGFIRAEQPEWKKYPYHQKGSLIKFPRDEGWHPEASIEWWYTNGHLVGKSSGHEYSYMLTYFYQPSSGYTGLRVFSITDETGGRYYHQCVPYIALAISKKHLELKVSTRGGSPVPQEWVTLKDKKGKLIPFQYHLSAYSDFGQIDLNYDARKRPLMVGDSGFVYLGDMGDYSYYYSQTELDVSGTLILNGREEEVTGSAWIDRQYGRFNILDSMNYEWLSCNLSNEMDLTIWTIYDKHNRILNKPSYKLCTVYKDDSTYFTTWDFEMVREGYVYMSDRKRCYSNKWFFKYDDIELSIETVSDDQEVRGYLRFYEGSTRITGKVGGESVTGKGFAELSHSFQKPVVKFIMPDNTTVWDGSAPVKWMLMNRDDGINLRYTLELLIRKEKPFLLVSGLEESFYHWNPDNLDISSDFRFRITASSSDNTLFSADTSEKYIKIKKETE